MEEITKMHVDWKKITVVGALVILTAITIGGLTWYVATAGAQDELEAYKNDIVRLETEIKQLQAEEAPTENTATDPTANWKTYTNSTYGVSFKYPEMLTFTDKTTEIRGSGNNNLDYLIVLETATNTINGYRIYFEIKNETVSAHDEIAGVSIPNLAKTTKTINSMLAYVYSGEGTAEGESQQKEMKHYMFFKDGKTHTIGIAENSPANNIELVDNIADTLKFN